jgi:HAD superfamily hydrolase (TIGR01509 family)
MSVNVRRLTTIVFDVDGTLYRQGALRRAMLLKLVGAAISNPGSGLATFRALNSYRRAQELLRDGPVEGDLASAHLRLASEHSGQSEAVVARTVARWMEREPLGLLERVVEPTLRRFLLDARSRGLRMGVLSDYPAADKLAAMGLAQYFDVVVSAQDAAVNRFKPHPSGLIEALRRLGANPEQAVYIGDRPDVDGAVARAAGVGCIIVGGHRARNLSGTSIHVSNYDDLGSMLFSSEPGSRP